MSLVDISDKTLIVTFVMPIIAAVHNTAIFGYHIAKITYIYKKDPSVGNNPFNRLQILCSICLAFCCMYAGFLFFDSEFGPDSCKAIYKWIFKILTCLDDTIYIGIDSSNKKYINSDYGHHCRECDMYSFGQGNIYHEHLFSSNHYGTKIKEKEIIIMEINTQKQTLKYYTNDKDHGIAAENIDFINNSYHLAIGLYDKEDSVQLKKFEQIALC